MKQLKMRLPCKFMLFFIPFIQAGDTGLPYGHPNRCRDYLNVKYADLPTLGELPGEGFDNLVNIPMAAVVDTKYTMCKTTDDGHFLIPDSVTVIPTKESHLKTTSSYFQHWDNFTSTTSSSINIEAGYRSFFLQISGKFSKEYETIKTRQYFQKTRTMRMQLRHSRYRAHLVHGASLHPSFKRALEAIADHILSDRKELATYESQLLVRQYGTHVVTAIELGASLVKVDQLREGMDTKSELDKHNIQLAAEISFFNWLDSNHNRTRNYSLGFGFTEASLNQAMSQYISIRQSTEMFSLGGSIITLQDSIDHSWGSSVEGNLVALDRMGDPIYYFVNEDTLPGIPDSVLEKLSNEIRDAVDNYYQQNVIRGCTDPKSPNFSFQANFNDGSCKAEINTSNYTFGGVYQECSTSGEDEVCQGIRNPNPLTGSYSCPSGFQPKLINSGTKSQMFTRKERTDCGFSWLSSCYNYYHYRVYGYYKAYWCYGSPGVNPLLFGGVFTPYRANIVTQEQSCPQEFQTIKVLDYLSVCVSQDKEQGRKSSLPFAGFYSCQSGNPFDTNKHGCPNGFSQHLAYVDDGCEIDYCIESGAILLLQLQRIQRPPYMDKPMYNETDRLGVAKNGTMVELNDISPVSDTVPIFEYNEVKASRGTSVRAFIVYVVVLPHIIYIFFRQKIIFADKCT